MKKRTYRVVLKALSVVFTWEGSAGCHPEANMLARDAFAKEYPGAPTPYLAAPIVRVER